MSQRPGFPVKLNTSGAPSKSARLTAPANKSGSGSAKPAAPVGVGLDSSAVRARMVRKLAEQGVRDASVLEAMGRVERHRFVESALVNQAYEDTSLPIGLGQTISKPSVVARMLELLLQGRSQPLGRVLEIGTGCAYQAAVLSALAREVYSMERLKALHDKAKHNLRFLRLPNVHLLLGDGTQGFAEGAPYAGIVAAAGGDDIPSAWLDQLDVGGRLVAPVRTAEQQQQLVVIDKTPHGCVSQMHEAVWFVPLKSGVA